MKLTIERNTLVKALAHVARVVERRNTYPILANIHIDAGGNGLTLRATDLDIEVTETIPCSVSAPFTTTIPASTLHDIAKKLPDGCEVTIQMKDAEGAIVAGGRSRFNLACLSPDSFPDLKSGAFGHEFTMPAATLAGLFARTQFAISSEETRYYLNGIYLHVIDAPGGHTLRAVATDGHRMARTETSAPDGCVGMPGIIIPKKTIGEVQKLLDGTTEDVTVEVSDTKIRFTVGSVVLLSKLIEGTFPDYIRVTPMNNEKIMNVDRAALGKMVDRVGTVASERGGKAVKLSISDGMLTASVTNPDHGEATEDMPADSEIDGNFEIGFNARYLQDVLSEVEGDQVQFKFNDAGSPTLVSAPGNDTTIFVLMPMRVA